ncbi:MAG: DUF5333 domain-containing protein [Rhodobacterales bacterium]|nr:DUF5333 domain-containing protein [Rhodobacterales bacterium]
MSLILITILAVGLGGAAGAARADLADEQDINSGLLAISVADKIRRECSQISGRFLTGRAYATQLKSMASQRGYSDEEIETYVNDSAGKAKMRERRNAYFKSKGASNLDAASLCRLGRDEIKNRSLIGSFLKVK